MPENNGAPETPSATSGPTVPEQKPEGAEPQNEAPHAEVDQERNADAGASTADTGKSWWDSVVWAAPVLGVVISVVTAFYTPATQANQLTVVAALIPAGDHSELRGRVLKDGDAQDKALVWAIVTDARGHRDSPPATLTDDKGGFDISQVPSKLGNAD